MNVRDISFGVRRVLIVDENADAADSLYLLLSFVGYDARVARCAGDAVETCRRFKAQVAMVSIGLPDTQGLELTTLLRQQLGEDTVFIAMTGWADQESERRARDVGFDHYFVKPLDFDRLDALLQQRVRRNPALNS